MSMTVSKIPQLPQLTGMPAFDSHIPFVGAIDLNRPAELIFFGGFVVNLFFVSGFSKWIIAAGIVAARYEYEKYRTKAT